MPVQKEIIYPIFLECCQFAVDTFWVNVFEDLAYGKTPHGAYISKSFLCCSYKNKEFSYKIERKEPQLLYTDVYNLLTNKLGILSKKDKVKQRQDFNQTESRLNECRQDWGDIRKKNIKDLLIERFVLDMKKEHSLTLKQSKNLLSIIFIAIVFKVITNKDIIYSDGKITSINGIEISRKKIALNRCIYDENATFSIENEQEKKKMSDNWEKYITLLKKKN